MRDFPELVCEKGCECECENVRGLCDLKVATYMEIYGPVCDLIMTLHRLECFSDVDPKTVYMPDYMKSIIEPAVMREYMRNRHV